MLTLIKAPRHTSRAQEGERVADRKDFDMHYAHRDRLRWRLMLLVGQKQTQKKYVAWLRTDRFIDPGYLASEEALLTRLEERVQEALAALR